MDPERKTLAEFSRAYLRSLETRAIVKPVPYDDNAEGRLADRVAICLRRAQSTAQVATLEA
jgi:hypothetical protein